jgi:general secretion pathway protein L
LEEDLAEDVEQLHFALAPRQLDETYPVAVVSRALMTQWLEQLSAVGLIPQALIPDVLALPQATENAWSLLLEKDRALLRKDTFSGFTFDPANAEDLLNCALEEANVKPEVIEVYGTEGEDDPRLPSTSSITYQQRDGSPPGLWAAGLDAKRAINLLQAQYRTKSDLVRVLKPWRAAAAVIGIWLVLQVVEFVLDYQRLAAEDRALQAKIEQIYRNTFPNTSRIVNARIQMEQQLDALRQASKSNTRVAFMPLMDAGARAIQPLTGVKIDALDYLNGRLEVSLNARELDALDAIKQNLEGQGLTAYIQSAETRGAEVIGRLVIREAHG